MAEKLSRRLNYRIWGFRSSTLWRRVPGWSVRDVNKTSGTDYPVTPRHVEEVRRPQLHHSQSLKTCFSTYVPADTGGTSWTTLAQELCISPQRVTFRLQLLARLPMDRFTSNFILETIIKMCQENPNLLQLGQNIWHFTWRPKKVVLWPVTLKRQKSSL